MYQIPWSRNAPPCPCGLLTSRTRWSLATGMLQFSMKREVCIVPAYLLVALKLLSCSSWNSWQQLLWEAIHQHSFKMCARCRYGPAMPEDYAHCGQAMVIWCPVRFFTEIIEACFGEQRCPCPHGHIKTKPNGWAKHPRRVCTHSGVFMLMYSVWKCEICQTDTGEP